MINSMNNARGNTVLKVATKTLAVGFISIGLSNVGDIHLPSSLSILRPAVADVRAQQKRTYFRFAPKVFISQFINLYNILIYLHSWAPVLLFMASIWKVRSIKMIGPLLKSSLKNMFLNTIQTIKPKSTKPIHTLIITYFVPWKYYPVALLKEELHRSKKYWQRKN